MTLVVDFDDSKPESSCTNNSSAMEENHLQTPPLRSGLLRPFPGGEGGWKSRRIFY